jgi:hypothetical protein
MRSLRHQRLPFLLCSLLSSREPPLSILILLSTPLPSHTDEIHTSLRTHTLPLPTAELCRLVARVVRDVRTMITKSLTVSKYLSRNVEASRAYRVLARH